MCRSMTVSDPVFTARQERWLSKEPWCRAMVPLRGVHEKRMTKKYTACCAGSQHFLPLAGAGVEMRNQFLECETVGPGRFQCSRNVLVRAGEKFGGSISLSGVREQHQKQQSPAARMKIEAPLHEVSRLPTEAGVYMPAGITPIHW